LLADATKPVLGTDRVLLRAQVQPRPGSLVPIGKPWDHAVRCKNGSTDSANRVDNWADVDPTAAHPIGGAKLAKAPTAGKSVALDGPQSWRLPQHAVNRPQQIAAVTLQRD
jgi:hypothetical protein